jgi:hypothetical protein
MRHRLAPGPWLAFTPEWFADHQRVLLWLLAAPVLGRWFRWVLCVRPGDAGHGRPIVGLFPDGYIAALPDGRLTADLRTHWKYAKRIYYAFRPLWWALHAWDWAVADRLAPALSYGFATLTAYPDPDPESLTVDGYVARTGFTGPVDESWSTIRLGAGNESADTFATVSEGPVVYTGASAGLWRYMSRVICLFNTSALARGAVTAATFSVYGLNKYNASFDPSLSVYSTTPASNTAIVNADYGTFGSTALADTVAYASVTTAGYNDFTLNATGLAAVSVSGITKLGLRLTADADNAEPTWGSAVARSGFGFYLADQTGTANDPKLVVTYEPASRVPPKNIGRPRPFAPGLAR